MEVCYTTTDLITDLQQVRSKHSSIGLVPTMGALHEGHFALIRESKRDNEFTVCSIYVNPTQFNDRDDFNKYPKSLEKDLKILDSLSCDIVFCPSDEEMYPVKPRVGFTLGTVGDIMEGKYRPGHFNGVLLAVSKLLNKVQPDIAYFGQKDLQQYMLIRYLAEDLSFPVKIKRVETVREESGLAFSSRNRRLSGKALREASNLYKGLLKGKEKLSNEVPFTEVKPLIENYLCNFASIKLEYLELVETDNFQVVNDVESDREYALCIAAYVDDIRLIDNVIFEVDR